MREKDPISIACKNKYPQKDKTEHLFMKAPGNYTWDINMHICQNKLKIIIILLLTRTDDIYQQEEGTKYEELP